jgi:hypothetical protein
MKAPLTLSFSNNNFFLNFQTARQIRSVNRVSPCEIQFDLLLRERVSYLFFLSFNQIISRQIILDVWYCTRPNTPMVT